MTELEKEFEQAMRNIYTQCSEELNYQPTIFLNMVNKDGAVRTARTLIMKSQPSDGYVRLWEEGRLGLTVEATLVKNKQFHTTELFPDIEELLKKAKRRLKEYKYDFGDG